MGDFPWLTVLGLLSLGIWMALWRAHGSFWKIDREPVPPPPETWPSVTAVIPARNEVAVIGETLRSLWRQAYPGRLTVIVVDDHSEDGTADVVRQTARELGRTTEVRLVTAPPLPADWTGKVWAMQQGLEAVRASGDPPRYVLFSDADIRHGDGALRELVGRAETGGCDLVSFMVRLQCRSRAEKWMIPAFVFFFKLLYPFRRVNDPKSPVAGAAGGTMLARCDALERIGGLTCIRRELIDDCSLAREIKRGGHRIWLGESRTSESLRGYGSLREIIHMIARTAYTQLGYAPARLVGCCLGLGLTFLSPPLLALFGGGWTAVCGGAAWVLMAALYLPMVRFYGLSPVWAVGLPVTACVYLWATVVSAWRHHRGQGGKWKGRAQSGVVTRK